MPIRPGTTLQRAPRHEVSRASPSLHRLRQTRLRRSRPQRLLLALMRRPARQPDHVEGGADAAVGVGKAFAHRSAPSAAWWRGGSASAAARPGYWSRPCAEIGHQRERAVIAHHDAIDVGDRQRKARALQQAADIAQIGKRRDARRHPAFEFGFGGGEGLPELGQRIAADHRRQQQPVGLQRAADLRQHAGQIVDELKGERGNRKIERFRLQRQRLGLAFRQIDPRRADRRARRARCGPDRPRVPISAASFEFPQHRVQAAPPCPRRRGRAGSRRARARARGPAGARSKARSNRMGAAVGFGAMPVGTPISHDWQSGALTPFAGSQIRPIAFNESK